MLGKIAWKNMVYRPLNTALCVSLLLFGVGIISTLLVVQHQIEQKFERDLEGIDLVIGAKGSPLQLVLSAVYHLDAPTGNIKLSEARKIMDNPLVAQAIPLAYGDSYRGYRIVGSTPDYLIKYRAQFAEGRPFKRAMEAVIGANVAEKTGLRKGATFLGTHGEVAQGHVHDDHPYTVVGVLEKTNTVLDRLVLTNIESVWQVHDDAHGAPPPTLATHREEGHDHDAEHNHADGHDHDAEHNHEDGHDHDAEHNHEDGHDHDAEHNHEDGHDHDAEHNHEDGHDHAAEHNHEEGHDHDAEHNHEDGHDHDAEHNHADGHDHAESSLDEEELEITALLLQYKTKMSAIRMPQLINEQTKLQAVLPALEINRLFYLLGIGTTTLQLIAGGIVLMAGFSIFFVLYGRLRERQFELALMRSAGYRPGHLFGLLILEGLLLTAVGYLLGWLLSRGGIYLINQRADSDFQFQFSSAWVPEEGWLLMATLLLGILAAFLPAWRAMRLDVSAILSKS
ncbi:MAG: FtsX-like permease family protein [Bacteroidota bacterium]